MFNRTNRWTLGGGTRQIDWPSTCCPQKSMDLGVRKSSTHQYRWPLGWGKFWNLWTFKTTLKVSRRTAKDRAFGKLLRPKTTIDFHAGPQEQNQWTYPGRHHWKPWFLRLWFYFVFAGQEQTWLHSSRTKVFNGGAQGMTIGFALALPNQNQWTKLPEKRKIPKINGGFLAAYIDF